MANLKREALLASLRELEHSGDTEVAHWEADKLLLDYINDEEITAAYLNVPAWYA